MKLSKEERDQFILDNYKSMSNSCLAYRTGWGISAIKAVKRRLGLSKEHPKEGEIIKWAKTGLSPSEVGLKVGVRPDITSDIMIKHGLDTLQFMLPIIEKYPNFDFSNSKYKCTKTSIDYTCRVCSTKLSSRPNDLVTLNKACQVCKDIAKRDLHYKHVEELKNLSALELLNKLDMPYTSFKKAGLNRSYFIKMKEDYDTLDSFAFLRRYEHKLDNYIKVPKAPRHASELYLRALDKLSNRGLLEEWDLLESSDVDFKVLHKACGSTQEFSWRTQRLRGGRELKCTLCYNKDLKVPKNPKEGEYYVYLLELEETGVYKIGVTKNLERRRRDIITTFRRVDVSAKDKSFKFIGGFDRTYAYKLEEFLLVKTEVQYYPKFLGVDGGSEVRKGNIVKDYVLSVFSWI